MTDDDVVPVAVSGNALCRLYVPGEPDVVCVYNAGPSFGHPAPLPGCDDQECQGKIFLRRRDAALIALKGHPDLA